MESLSSATDEYSPFHVLVASTTLGLFVFLLWNAWLRRSHLPPGPMGLPLLGCLHLLGRLPHQSLAKLAKQYGPLMALRLGQFQYIVASTPEAAMEFLKAQDANFCLRPPIESGRVMFGPDILFQSPSSEWRLLRKLFHLGLTSTKRLDATHHIRNEEVAHMLRSLPVDCEFNMRKHLGVLVTSIISRLVLSRSFGSTSPLAAEQHSRTKSHDKISSSMPSPSPSPTDVDSHRDRESQAFRNLMGAVFKGLSAFYPADFIPTLRWVMDDFQGLGRRFRDTSQRMEAFAAQIIVEHQARRARGPVVTEQEQDMVHALLDEAEKCNERSGPQITMGNMKGIMWDAFSGGTDTILFSSEWIMSELVNAPRVQAAAQAELDRVVGRHRRVLESDLRHLHYIQALVKEGLRLHPIAPLMAPHLSLDATQAFGYDIPANTRLFVNVWAIARDPSVWSDPLEFQPERWLEETWSGLAATKTPAPGAFLPFGAGRRMCPGMALGLVTLEYSVASLLQAFEWSVTEDPASARAEGPGMGVPRAKPLRVTAKPRLSSQVIDA